MWPETRWSLVLLGIALAVLGVWLLVKRPSADLAGDSPTGRLIGGFVLIAFGLVLGAVGIVLLSTGR